LLDGEIIFINVPSAQIFILHTNKSQGTKNEKQALITACLAVIIKALLCLFNTPPACGGVKGGAILPPLWN